jgi:hypothetical protein
MWAKAVAPKLRNSAGGLVLQLPLYRFAGYGSISQFSLRFV